MTLWEKRGLGQVDGGGNASFVCECAETSCIDRIGVPLGVYERVVDIRDGYLVGDAAAVAERAARRP
jgi:hypothetical protein